MHQQVYASTRRDLSYLLLWNVSSSNEASTTCRTPILLRLRAALPALPVLPIPLMLLLLLLLMLLLMMLMMLLRPLLATVLHRLLDGGAEGKLHLRR